MTLAETRQAETSRLQLAAEDLRYLLDRGYPKESTARFVGDKYNLDKTWRSALYRGVFSHSEARLIKSKRMRAREMAEKTVCIDGFNVLNTVEAHLRGSIMAICDDAVLRDFSEIHGKYKIGTLTTRSLEKIALALSNLHVSEAKIFLDSQVSHSGDIAARARKTLSAQTFPVFVETEKTVDRRLLREKGVPATSDSAVLLKAESFFDLAQYIVIYREKRRATLIKF